jgi:hypothetical protein
VYIGLFNQLAKFVTKKKSIAVIKPVNANRGMENVRKINHPIRGINKKVPYTHHEPNNLNP